MGTYLVIDSETDAIENMILLDPDDLIEIDGKRLLEVPDDTVYRIGGYLAAGGEYTEPVYVDTSVYEIGGVVIEADDYSPEQLESVLADAIEAVEIEQENLISARGSIAAKLVAGTPLTEEEAALVVGSISA